MEPSTKIHVPKHSVDNQDAQSIIDTARKVLKIESHAIAELGSRIDSQFVDVVHHLNKCKHLVITGVGKSGLIGKKISSTFSSIGLPSLFLHASEASHGDLGMISDGDTVIAISNSGETEEIVKLLPVFNRIQCTLVGMTGNMQSSLAKRSDYVLNVRVKEEACSKTWFPQPAQLPPWQWVTHLPWHSWNFEEFRKRILPSTIPAAVSVESYSLRLTI